MAAGLAFAAPVAFLIGVGRLGTSFLIGVAFFGLRLPVAAAARPGFLRAFTDSMLALSTSIRSTTLVDGGAASTLVTISLPWRLASIRASTFGPVGVVVLLRVPLALHRFEQESGHLNLALGDLARIGEGRQVLDR